ncbi:MAG: DUF362 domain-containing protein [Phycisphaerales bacterium]|nr:MAG: DUF362 domain-containing protein [Phycisphaerales bacterium]
MATQHTRRDFLARVGAAAAGVALTGATAPGCSDQPAGTNKRADKLARRVVIARDEKLAQGAVDEHRDLLRKLLNGSVQRLTGAPDAGAAWRGLFGRKDRVGIKVNTLGLSTQPAVADAVVAGLRHAGVPAENIIIWDRFDVELQRAGYKLNASKQGVRCFGTDAEEAGRGYQGRIESSGRIGSCFSRIVADQVDALISVPVLKDHNLAGVSLGMKNFYGAIHNPNKYHDHNCDPYIADVVAHRFIGPKWRLTVVDATRAQYHAGPGQSLEHAWPFGGLIVSGDFVAGDAVAADLLEAKRKTEGLESLTDEKRPPVHIATAGARGLGEADLSRIERIEV